MESDVYDVLAHNLVSVVDDVLVVKKGGLDNKIITY